MHSSLRTIILYLYSGPMLLKYSLIYISYYYVTKEVYISGDNIPPADPTCGDPTYYSTGDMIHPKPKRRIAICEGNVEPATTTQRGSTTSMVKPSHSISDPLTSTSAVIGTSTSADESLFTYWRQCNLESVIADLNETETNNDKSITIQCATRFRDLPKNEKRKWETLFKKHQSQNSISVSKDPRDGHESNSPTSVSATKETPRKAPKRKAAVGNKAVGNKATKVRSKVTSGSGDSVDHKEGMKNCSISIERLDTVSVSVASPCIIVRQPVICS